MTISKEVTPDIEHMLRQAIQGDDTSEVARVVDLMRFGLGMDYHACFELAHALTGIREAMWDCLLYEAAQLASRLRTHGGHERCTTTCLW